jgi:hypothetical protein
MFYRKQHINIFKALHIRNPEQVYNAYMSNPHTAKMLEDRSMLLWESDNIRGGGKIPDKNDVPPRRPYVEGTSLLMESENIKNVKEIPYNFEGRDFKIFEGKVGDGYDIAIYQDDKDDGNHLYCLHIITYPNDSRKCKNDNTEGNAVIQNISYHETCVSLGIMESGGGTILLKLAIQFLKDKKERYKIKRIVLMDNSLLKCTTIEGKKEIKRIIRLGLIHTLKFGHTWYGGKYGFRPYDSTSKKTDKILNELYENNISIVANTKISDYNLFDIIHKYLLKRSNADVADKYIKDLKQACKKLKITTIQQFFNTFYLEYKKECYLLSKIVKKICKKIGIRDFFTKAFFLKI